MTPTLADVLDTAVNTRLSALHFSFPARVESYDASQQRASVQPLVLQGFIGEDGERQTERLPVVPDVPIMFPRSGPFAMTWPVAVGSLVWVVVANCSIGRYLQGTGGEVDPGVDQRQALTDAVAFPCGSTFGAPIAGADEDAMVLHASALKLGSAGASDKIARESDLEALKAKILAAPDGLTFGSALKLSLDAPPVWPDCSSIVESD